ncbi:MAG: hypothetical protein LBQ59_00960 [Candidatus Peribacteria bacterium]|nr:hypothetical protein [Candidatus Peribacteria bacterium]
MFDDSDLEKLFAELQSFFRDTYFAQCMLQRVDQLKSADSLLDVKHITNANLHPLKGSRRYELAIDVDTTGKRGKRRIVFEQVNGDDKVCDDFYNEQKHKNITEIHILAVDDYH